MADLPGPVLGLNPIGSLNTVATDEAISNMRYAGALLQVSLASTFTVDPADQGKAALGELIRVLGAQRGFLFLEENGTQKLLAAKDRSGKDLIDRAEFNRKLVCEVAEGR